MAIPPEQSLTDAIKEASHHSIMCTCPMCTYAQQSLKSMSNMKRMQNAQNSMQNAKNAQNARNMLFGQINRRDLLGNAYDPISAPAMVFPAIDDAVVREFVVGDRPGMNYNVTYYCEYERLFETDQDMLRAWTLLKAAVSGETPGVTIKLRGVGSARNLKDGSTYFRVFI